MNKKWESYKVNENLVSKIAKEHNISELMARVILNRNIPNEKIEAFLHPKLSDLYDPFLFDDMEKAVTRILEAIDKKEKITIYGDYDVDGITSATVLMNILKSVVQM